MNPSAAVHVLDTNVVLDWLVFADARVAPALDQALAAGRLGWIATRAMADEFAEVLRRGLRSRPGLDAAPALARFARDAREVAPAPPLPARWRCRDADDQKFVDLALAHPGAWLVTRDRALLALAKPAGERGVRIVTPAVWAAARRDAPVSIA